MGVGKRIESKGVREAAKSKTRIYAEFAEITEKRKSGRRRGVEVEARMGANYQRT